MKLEDRIVIVGGYIAGRGDVGTRRCQHNRCGEARG
jgi:hypothetical protein